jgi:TonB family protein
MVHPAARAWSPSRFFAASALAHAALTAALFAVVPRTRPPPPSPPPLVTVDLTLEAPPPPPSPAAPPSAPVERAEAPAPQALRVTPRLVARVPVAPRPTAVEPPPPAPAITPAPPPVAPAPPPPPVLRATDLLRAGNDLALRSASTAPPLAFGGGPARDRTLFAGTGADPLGHARAALAQDLREGMRSTMAREAPGVRTYLWGVRRRMNEAWRPGVVRVPNLAETLAASFGVNSRQVEAMGRWWRERQTAMTAERDRGGAIDAIESIGGTTGRGSEGLSRMPNDSLNEAWRRNTRITRAEVRVDQSPEGRVLDVRVVRSSGAAAFDRAALEAVRQGLDAQDPIPLPGGRRSVWSFTVVATRRLIAANIGGAFDESRGWFQVQLPGSVSMRSRVFMESSEPMPTDG